MKVPDLFVGKQLYVGCAVPPASCLGIGPAKIRGSAYLEGPVLVGTPLTYPIAEANLMVARCTNLESIPIPPSIFKVSTRGLAPTPIDVMLGDPTGLVGISVNSTQINIINATFINIQSPVTSGKGILEWSGAKSLNGVVAETGAEARSGAEAVSASTVDNGAKNVNGVLTVAGNISIAGVIQNGWLTGELNSIRSLAGKGFDIPHPTKKDHRLRYICLEGPEVGAYIRGTLNGSDTIDLPDYWRELVYPESITVNLTPIGQYQELYVEENVQWGTKIKVKNNSGNKIHCHYTVFGERVTHDKLQPEYKGLTPDDYPGDNTEYALGGWDYARHKGEHKTSNL